MLHAKTTAPVSPDLAEWFTAARRAGRLPFGVYDLAPGVRVTEPGTLYSWLAGVIERGDAGATAREAERAIEALRRLVEG